MEKMISTLFEIEEKANLIINRANEEKIRLYREFEIDAKRMEDEISAETSEKLRMIQTQMDEELKMEKQALLDKNQLHLKDLEIHFINNKTKLVNSIFESIIHFE